MSVRAGAKRARGPSFAYNQFVMFTAVLVVALLAWQWVRLRIFGLDGWRWVVIIGSVGALPVWWLSCNLPGSPRWLAQHREAERIVLELEKKIQAEAGKALPPRESFSGIFPGFVIAFFLDRYGTPGVFGFIAGAMLMVFTVISVFGPAVTQRRLEEIAA